MKFPANYGWIQLDPFSCVILFSINAPWTHGCTTWNNAISAGVLAQLIGSAGSWSVQCGQDWVLALGFSSCTMLVLSKLGFIPSTYTCCELNIHEFQCITAQLIIMRDQSSSVVSPYRFSLDTMLLAGHSAAVVVNLSVFVDTALAFVWHWPVRAWSRVSEAHVSRDVKIEIYPGLPRPWKNDSTLQLTSQSSDI